MDYAFKNPGPWHHGGRSRSLAGITLIEVMMSAMVVSLGIMGLVALIPLGTHLTERGTRADRVASIGERAYHEAKIRGYLNPVSWVSHNGTILYTPHATPSRVPVRQPYLIDPWFFPDNSTEANRYFFPASRQFAFGGDPIPLSNMVPPTAGKPMQMHRLSVLSGPNSGNRMPRRQAAIAFMSEDDLSSERPSDGDRPPFQTYFTRGTENTPVRRQAQGDYTWMLMLVPEVRNISALNPPGAGLIALSPPMNYANPGVPAGPIRDDVQRVMQSNLTDEYNLSVIVMQRRQPRIPLAGEFNPMFTGTDPSERVLVVDPTSFANTDGYSTGEVILRINRGAATPEQVESMLRLSNGDWICLAAGVPGGSFSAGHVYQWYRVSSVSDIIDPAGATPSIEVTFTGPDWSAASPPTHAIIVEGVVGVYTKRVRLDLSTY